jgi:hypothetical protein
MTDAHKSIITLDETRTKRYISDVKYREMMNIFHKTHKLTLSGCTSGEYFNELLENYGEMLGSVLVNDEHNYSLDIFKNVHTFTAYYQHDIDDVTFLSNVKNIVLIGCEIKPNYKAFVNAEKIASETYEPIVVWDTELPELKELHIGNGKHELDAQLILENISSVDTLVFSRFTDVTGIQIDKDDTSKHGIKSIEFNSHRGKCFANLNYYGSVTISACHLFEDTSVLSDIETVNISYCSGITKIEPMNNVNKVTIQWCDELCDISGLLGINDVTIIRCDSIKDYSPLAKSTNVTIKNGLINDDVLEQLKEVKNLTLEHCAKSVNNEGKEIDLTIPVINFLKIVDGTVTKLEMSEPIKKDVTDNVQYYRMILSDSENIEKYIEWGARDSNMSKKTHTSSIFSSDCIGEFMHICLYFCFWILIILVTRELILFANVTVSEFFTNLILHIEL